MHAVRTLVALSFAALATACASPGYTNATPQSTGMAPMTMGAPGSMTAMEPRMMAMHEMHQKMAKATPTERQALMADHMKAMQGGMAMMKEMHAMHAGGGKGGMGMMGSHGSAAPMAGMGDGSGSGKGMPTDMTKSHQMMTDHMATMQMMMDMMADRMPPAAAGQ